MVAEEEALVGGVDDDGVLVDALLLEVVEHLADGVVDGLDAAEVVLHIAEVGELDALAAAAFALGVGECGVVADFLGPAVAGFAGLVLLGVDAGELAALGEVFGELEVGLDAHVVLEGHGGAADGGGAALAVVEEGVGGRDVGEGELAEGVAVLGLGEPVAVGGLVEHGDEEGLALGEGLVDDALGDAGEVVGGVFAGEGDAAVGEMVLGVGGALLGLGEEVGVEVLALVLVDGPAVPVGVADGLGAAHVPLAEEGGVVAAVAEGAADGLDLGGDVVEDGDAVLAAVHARHDAGARGGADGVRHEDVLEEGALLGQAVDARGLVDARAVGADGVGGVVIGHDEEDVGAFLAGGGLGEGEGGGAGRGGQGQSAPGGLQEVSAIGHVICPVVGFGPSGRQQ